MNMQAPPFGRYVEANKILNPVSYLNQRGYTVQNSIQLSGFVFIFFKNIVLLHDNFCWKKYV